MRTTFQKLRQAGQVMVPSRSASHINICDTLVVAIGRHSSLSSIGAVPLPVACVAHVLTATLIVPCFSHGSHISCAVLAVLHALIRHTMSHVLEMC